TGLDRLVRRTLPGEMATLIVAVIDTVTGQMEHVRAGHLPPLLLGAAGSADWPTPSGTLPIGYVPSAPVAGTTQIPRGGAVVLFTDGLVEQRGASLPDRLERLRVSAACRAVSNLDLLISEV